MAVIKIVPMPGAVGDKGDEGAVGPQGQQGETGLQGPAGADALWSYNGEYNPGAGYAVGDVVTFDGQLWYRKNSNGGNVGDTPSEGLFWDLLAAKGTDSIAPTSGTWDTKFAFHSGIDISVENPGYEANKMGYYYCVGDLVHWEFRMLMSNPVSWGSAETWAFELPFPPYYSNDYVGTGNPLKNIFNRTIANGWFRVNADADPTPVDGLLTSENNYDENEYHVINASALLRTYPRTESGSYTTTLPGYPYPANWPANADLVGMAFITALNEEPETNILTGYSGNTKTIGYKHINSTWPANLVQALADQNDGVPANSATPENPDGFNQNSIQFNFSGVYRKA
jgi:hypothetical protein